MENPLGRKIFKTLASHIEVPPAESREALIGLLPVEGTPVAAFLGCGNSSGGGRNSIVFRFPKLRSKPERELNPLILE